MPKSQPVQIDYDTLRSRLRHEFFSAGAHAPHCGLITTELWNGIKIYWRNMGGSLTLLAFAPQAHVIPITAFFLDELARLRAQQQRRAPATETRKPIGEADPERRRVA